MEDLDFRIGDEVFSLIHGNGKIIYIKDVEDEPIGVEFQHLSIIGRFTINGYAMHNIDQFRMLYHGHDLDINIDEKKPVRSKWCNIYKHKNTYTTGNGIYKSKDQALKNVTTTENISYIRTIELIEKEE